MEVLLNLDLLSVGITVAAAGLLGFIIFFNNPKSATSLHFLLFCFGVISWSIVNYLSYKSYSPQISIWVVRLVLFVSIWFVYSLFSLLYTFPSEKKTLPSWFKKFILPLTALVSLLTLSPLVFRTILTFSTEGIPQDIQTGPGIAVYAAYSLSMVVGGVFVFFRKIHRSTTEERKKYWALAYGIVTTFLLLLTFNLIFPAFLRKTQFVPLGPVFILPFAATAAYAIIRHHLLNVKVISTQILIFFLSLSAVVEVVIADSIYVIAFRVFVFILILGVGILLIKSVMREVEQRSRLERLSVELQKANEQLKKLDQARADFITLTSHQLRTPPATIKWYLAAIKSGDYGTLPEEIKEALTKAEITNNALISLIDDLLNASRIERGKMEFLFEPVALDELAKFTTEQLTPQAKMKGLMLSYEKPAGVIPEITADKEKIRQVINNFIDNAIKYTPKGAITVTLKTDKTYVSVEVSDTGKGISPDVIPGLFAKYNRGKDSITHATGIGIGLYVAKIVVENHKGIIEVKSAGTGKGSTFIFKLPIKNDLPHTKVMDLVAEQTDIA